MYQLVSQHTFVTFPIQTGVQEIGRKKSFLKTEKRASERRNNVLTIFIVMRTRKDEGNVDYKQLR